MTRVLVDTNILIYATDPTDMYYQISTDILSRGDISLFTTTKNISEFIAVSTKKNIELSKILEYVEYVCTHITVLYPDTKSLDIFLSLVRTYSPRWNHIYDMEVASIMLAHGIHTLATMNVKDFQMIPGIDILSR